MSSTSGAARKETSRCAHARGSTPRSPTTSSRSIACRPSSATHCDCKSPLPGTPAQPRLILGQNEESAHILLRKKPAARHLFQPLVFFICINHKRADKPIAAKIKASTKKAIPFSQKFDDVIISEENTQRKYCFLICMDFSEAFCGAKTAAGIPLRSGSCYMKYDIGL